MNGRRRKTNTGGKGLKGLLPVLVVLALAVAVYVVPELSNGDSSTPVAGTSSAQSSTVDGIPPISVDALPIEALDTIDLIDSGGPFPFDRDDLIFQNREALLPDQPNGYYREYTVITPGENHRGARRIVAGEQGELYYTADHYSSFSEIAFDPSG